MRYQFTHADRVKGGKARAAQESFRDACSLGFWACLDKHPFFARKHLKKKIRAFYQAKAQQEKP